MASILRGLANYYDPANSKSRWVTRLSYMLRASLTTTSIASTSSRITAGAREVNESFYELDRPPGIASMQLLFFHGLQFQNFTNVHLWTWESRDGKCMWPQEWLVEEFPGSHVLYVSYDGRVGKSVRNSVFDIYNIAENFISDLLQADIGQVPGCPVILVGHSVGGIVIKQVFCQAHELLGMTKGPTKEKLQTFLNNLNGIFFYGTPHHGSSIAEEAVDLCGGPLRDYFKILSKEAARLNHKFDRVCRMYPKLQMEGVGESMPTRLGNLGEVFIVPEASSRRDNFNIVDGVDHFTICKPMTKTKRSFYTLETFLSRIVGDVKAQGTSVLPENFQFVPDSIIGIDGPKEEIIEKLFNIPILGLVGMGGVGKSTLAKIIFNSMSQQFEYTCFVLNVKLIKGDEKAVKQEVWSQMYRHGRKVSSEEDWKNLKGKKLLLGLDDISTDRDAMILSELGQLTGSHSRFIMTSRDQNLVRHWGDIYEVPYLKDDAAMVLFQSFAFPGQGVPVPELGSIMKTIVRKCDGLPLTLEVLGKYLKAKSNCDVWKQTLLALDEAMDVKDMNERLWAKLRPSYEGLGPIEQQMFLDVTTFFSTSWQWTLGKVLGVLRVAYKTPIERILWGTLVDMSLVYDVKDDEQIKVHEQLQSLGRKIACEPSYSRKWRVWDGEKGLELLQTPSLLNGKELYALRLEHKSASDDDDDDESASDDDDDDDDDELLINIPTCALLKLKNLRFLEVNVPMRMDGAQEDGSFPTELVLLKCVGQNLFDPSLQSHLAYLELEGLEHLPSSIGQLSSLQHLVIASSPKLYSLPESFGGLSTLNHLQFYECENLSTLPESFGGLSSLNHLEFYRCENLSTLPESFGGLSSLNHLEFYDCPKLSSLPESFGGLSSLNDLEFHECENLSTLPESFGGLSSLNHLKFYACVNLRTLPESFGGLSSLNYLEFFKCENLSTLPESFGGLSSLNHLRFRNCENLRTLPESFGGLSSLNHLEFNECENLCTLPESFGGLSSLNHLEFYECENLRTLPESFGGLSSLNHLEFNECENLCTLPESFGGLSSLNHLEFYECENLRTLPESFGGLSSLNHLEFNECVNLHTLPDSFGGLSSLNHLKFYACVNLRTLPESFGGLSSLNHLEFNECENLCTLPESFGGLSSLNHLEFYECENLRTLPESFGGLSSSNHLAFYVCENLRTLPESFGGLSSLNHLAFYKCENLSTLPESFGGLSSLNHLRFGNCENLRTLPESFGGLSSLNHLAFYNCENLSTLPESFGGLSSLNQLELIYCDKLRTLPDTFGQLAALEELKMDCTLDTLPESLRQLKKLQFVKIRVAEDMTLNSLGDLKDLRHLKILLDSVASIPGGIKSLPSLQRLKLIFCRNLVNSLPPWLMTPNAPSRIGRGSRIWYTVEDGCFSVEKELYQDQGDDCTQTVG